MKDSPYLAPCRLGDVIAAIQVLAYYKFYKLAVDKWADRITGDAADAASLESVSVIWTAKAARFNRVVRKLLRQAP